MGEHPVILFDGGCNLCDSAVQFIIRRDPQARFKFAAMQSPAAQRLLGRQRLSEVSGATMVLIEDGEVFLKSTAALRIARRLPVVRFLMSPLILVPRLLRDRGYDFIARNRFSWFGRKRVCLLPSADVRRRFLD